MAQIKSLIANRDFYEAMNIVDTIDWRRVRSASMLGMVSEIYKVNRRYDDARDILIMMYNRNPELRTTVYALCEISIKLGSITDAVKYLKEYMRLAKGDSGVYILQYKLYRSQGVGLGECIELLKKLKAVEYDERWAYELAYLYHLDGQEKKCVEECDELIVWFGRGRYVTKAMELKMEHAALTEDQQRKYEKSEGKRVSDESLEEDSESNDLEETEVRLGDEVRENRPRREIKKEQKKTVPFKPRTPKEEPVKEETAEEETEKEEPAEEEAVREEPLAEATEKDESAEEETKEEKAEEVRTEEAKSEPVPEDEARFENAKPDPIAEKPLIENDSPMPIEIKKVDVSNQPTRRIPHREILNQINIDDIEVKPFNTGVNGTVNLQEEIRKNLAEFAKRTGQPIREKEERIPEPEELVKEEKVDTDIEVEPVEVPEEKTGDIHETEEIPEEKSAEAGKSAESLEVKAESEETEEAVDVEEPAQEERKAETRKRPAAKEIRRRYEPEDDADYKEESIRENDRPKEIKSITARLPQLKKAKPKYKAPSPKEVKGFSEEEKEIFADFLAMHELPELIKDALNNIEMTGNRGNVIITGNEESARIRLAGALANDLRETNPDFMGKIAKIKSELLNKKDIRKAIRSLDTGALLIERAGDLSEDSLNVIKEMLENQDTSIVLFLEDARLTMKKTLTSHSWMEDYFNVSINIPTYTNDDLVFHAREYARQKEYTIDDMGVLALYTRIDEMQTADHSVNINEVEKIVDSAIKHADRRTPGHLIDLIVGKRYDDNDLVVLREKDFIV